MHNLLLTVLALGVCFGCALGDVKCFLTHIGNCSTTVSKLPAAFAAPIPSTSPDFCKNLKPFFECVKETNKECSTEYDYDEVEEMYNDICTDGSFIYSVFMQHQECIAKSAVNHLSCSQDIMDFVKKFKVITPEVIFEITKLVCKERDTVSKCFYDFVEADCGKAAKVVIEVMSRPSDRLNEKICRDVLQLD